MNRALLLAGMLLGLVAAIADALVLRTPLPESAVARVGETELPREDYERLLAGIESERRTPLDDAGRRRLLDRMVDEQLLVAHALDLGLVQSVPSLRKATVDAVLGTLRAEGDLAQATEAQLREYHAQRAAYFNAPFEQVRDAVAAEWSRRQSEARLDELLAELRTQYDVELDPRIAGE